MHHAMQKGSIDWASSAHTGALWSRRPVCECKITDAQYAMERDQIGACREGLGAGDVRHMVLRELFTMAPKY